MISPTAIRLYLALVVSPRPVSMSRCGSWGFASFAEQLKILSEAVEQGWVAEAETAPAGRFAWVDAGAIEALFRQAEPDDWRDVLDKTDFRNWGLDAARTAAQEADLARARVLYWALVTGLRDDDAGDDGARWLEVVMEALRLFRREVNWLSASLQDRALDVAVRLGDDRAQAVLLATRAYEQLRTGKAGPAEDWCDRALAIAQRIDDPESRQHVLLYVANAWILLGRLSDALSMLESFLGDIPPDWLSPQGEAATSDTLTEASIATLANAYAWTGKDDRALDLLRRMVQVGEQRPRPILAKMGKVYLSGLFAEREDFVQAKFWGDAALEQLEPSDATTAYSWFASQSVAWVRMREGRADDAREQLTAGHRARLACGHMHFQNSTLLEVLAWLEMQGAEPIDGLSLAGELERILASPDARMRGVGHRFRATMLMSESGATAEVDRHLQESLSSLRASGAVPELQRTLRAAVVWAESQGRSEDVQRYGDQLSGVDQTGSAVQAAAQGGNARESHVARAIVDLGRLSLLAHRTEGFFGEVVARICRELDVERCALFDTTGESRLLATRGGHRVWLDAVESIVRGTKDTEVCFLSPPATPLDGPGAGQLVLIPYQLDDLQRRGWVCLENRRTRALVGPEDRLLLASLGVQISVLMGNVALWEELAAVRQRLERENRYYREESPTQVSAGRMVGESRAFRELFDLIGKVAPTKSAALVLGETGVGKELVAREIHRLSGNRKGPFIAVHVASMPPGLVASALFGHERGAFTGATEQVRGRFELAHGGTIFLDEIGELGPEDQVRLLRVLQEGAFERVGGTKTLKSEFRLVAATNRDLEAMAAEGRFREDLFYRLNVFPIRVPPLRERRSDIARLALHFLDRFARQAGRAFEGIGEADVDRLTEYGWPGNVRELEHVIERAVVLSEPPMLKIPELEGRAPQALRARGEREWVTIEECERRYVREVLEHTAGRVTGKGGAAELLGLKPSTLQWRIDKLGLREALVQARARKGKHAR